ncbi:hypothetical protein K2173_025943 [Erythroxylum novogranatense]|uniref:DYW domain-containing protein n=1 Tax=Erythroxylum novogranatense TaxID=1862640 RepID=A0AAV8SHN9_9ROSI|nr:hypothetical protein K2173_025943 [Erythroxylum novogranatense]
MLRERQRFVELLQHCSRRLLSDQGAQVHGAVVKMGFGTDSILCTNLIDMYGKCSRVGIAREVFDRMLESNVVSWTALMCGYVRSGYAKESLILFSRMESSGEKPNDFTFSTNLKACGMLNYLCTGMQIHCTCMKTGFYAVNVVGNSLIDMYSKCGRINEAAQIFQTILGRNLISWNSMIAGYTLAGFCEKALVLFQLLQEEGEIPDEFTLTTTLTACNGLGAIREAIQIHASLITTGFKYLVKTSISCALVDVYVKCGKLIEAQKVFDQIEKKHVTSWSVLILGYSQEGNLAKAIHLFRQLIESGIEIDAFVLSTMMGVFADFALVEHGKQIHAYAAKVRPGLDISVCNSIVDMYLKCGMIDEADRYFSEMTSRNVISWTVMITGYGKHGLGEKAITLFKKMQLDDIEPDDVTYLAILFACSHSGLVEEGQRYFSRLCADHRIKARVDHYACMVDLLGRAGRLKEAKNLIDTMPLKPNVGIWQTLLSSCRVHGDLDIGREVSNILLNLDGNNPVNYVIVSNMYADAGCWSESQRIRELVKIKKLKKEAGLSWIEIDKKLHFFYGGDDAHPHTDKIHGVLMEMERRMKEELGYVYGVKYALHDVEEESKEDSLRVHSEKLAIGLALVQGGLEKRIIRVFKNLRVCGDCHEFIKGLSKILKPVFMVRDANRFHRFEGGQCSCGDYW